MVRDFTFIDDIIEGIFKLSLKIPKSKIIILILNYQILQRVISLLKFST